MRLIKISGAHKLSGGLFLFKTEVPVGTVSTHKDGLQYMKIAPNKWAPVKKNAKGEHEFEEGRHGIHITKNAKGETVQGKLTEATKEHVKAAIAEKMKKEVAEKEKGQHQEKNIEKKQHDEKDFAEGDVVRAKKGSAKAKDDEKLEGIVGKVMKIKDRIVEIKNEAGKVFEVPRGMLAFVKARRRKDQIPGGKGDRLEVGDVDAKQLEMGIAEEMEHTGDRKLAEEIALDHLSEDPKYYSKLKTVFKAGKIGLTPKTITVLRAGKSFTTTVYVKPGEAMSKEQLQKKADDDSLGDVNNLNIVKYTDKAFAIVGETMKNLIVMRALREHLKIGGYNSTLKGWLFPMSKLAAAKEFLNAHFIPVPKGATAEEKKEIAEQQATLDFDTDTSTTVEGKISAEEKKEIGKPIDTTTGKVEVEEGKSADGTKRKPRAKKVDNVENPAGFVDVGAKIGGAKKDIRALSRQYELEKTQAMSRSDLEQLEADSPAVAQQLINKNRQLGVESLQEYMLHLKDDGVEYAAAVMIKRLVGAIANKCEDSPAGRQQYLAAFERFNLAAQSWKTLPEVLSGMQSFKDDLSGLYVPSDLAEKYYAAKGEVAKAVRDRMELVDKLEKERRDRKSPLWDKAIEALLESEKRGGLNPNFTKEDVLRRMDAEHEHNRKGYVVQQKKWIRLVQSYLNSTYEKEWATLSAGIIDRNHENLKIMREIQDVGKAHVMADASSNYNILKALGQDFGIAVGVFPRATSTKIHAWQKTNARWKDKVVSIQQGKSEDGVNNWGDYEGKVKDPSTGEKKPKGPAQPKMQWPRIEDMISDSVVRTGASDVTYNDSKKLLNDFGFRGIEYGTWMDTPTSKEHTQRCGEALHDLSAILGIDKTELSLNGRLSLAFGARGSGGKRAAAAHYEPGRKVINLTKFAGGGSLAHEWGHALDNVLGLVSSGGKSHLSFLSVDANHPNSHNNYDQMPESIKSAYKELEAAMTEGTFRPKTAFFVENNPNRKWSRLDGAKKMLADAGGDANKAMASYVATQIERADAAYRSYISYGYGKDQAEKYRTSVLNKARKSAKINAEALADLSGTNVSYMIPTGEPQSQYKATSEAQGKKYWGSKVEMFARAWESFVHDELKDRGIENTYLVGNNVSRAMWDKYNKGRGGAMYRSFYGEDAVYSIYPLGEERDRINNGFRKLIAAVKEHNMLQKAIRILDAEKMLLKAGRQPGEFAWCGGKPVVMLQPGDISQVLSMDLNGHPTIEYYEAVDVMSPKMLKAAPALMLRLTKFYEDYKRIKPGSSDVVDTELQKAGHGTAGLVRVKKTTTDGVSRYYWIRTDDKHETSHHVADSKKKSPDVNTSWHQHMTPSESEYSKIVSGDKNVLGAYMHRVFFNQNNNAGSSLVNAVTKNLTRSIHTIGFDPEDIAMETILRVMDKQDKKQLTAEKVPRNKMGVFVAQIFKNVASEMMKRRHVEKEVADDVNTFADKIADTSHPDESGITDNDVTGAQQQAHEVVQAVLDNMPTRNRERNQQIFKDYLAGKSHKEIADKHGITELASKKAVAKLNERVSAEMQRRGIELSRKKVKLVSASGTFKAVLNWLTFDLFKARDVSKLTKKVITNKRGHRQTVWIRTEDGKQVEKTNVKKDVTDTQTFKDWFGNSKVVDEHGKPLVVFHGDYRADKVGATPKISKSSSGRFYFTDDPSIASNYSEGKVYQDEQQSDFKNWFTFPSLKYKGERTAPNLHQAWYRLNDEQKKKVAEVLLRAGRDEETGEITTDGDGNFAGKSTWEYNVKRAHGNFLAAADEVLLASGSLFDEERELLKILEKAGIKADFDDPREARSGVMPVYLRINNPVDTADEGSLKDIYEKLSEKFKSDRSRAKDDSYAASGSQWDKDKQTPKSWLKKLADDIENGDTHAWTVMPEKITLALQEMGYDGVKDSGGKGGGTKHKVWIAFEPNQIKSKYNKGSFSLSSDNIMKARDISKLTKKVIVNRRGHKQTVWIRVQDGQPVASTSNSAMIADLQIQPYSAKSIVVKGNTLKHLSTLRALRSKLGIGGWNQTIGGWIFPATKADAVAQFLHGSVTPQSPDGQRVLKEVKAETEKQETQIKESGREGILSKAFKSWFGDWQRGEGSKVVNSNFEPQEQTNIDVAPEVVYHGTAVGGFSEFKIGSEPGIYGDGLYFTSDKEIATEYTEKDSGPNDRERHASGVLDEQGNEVSHIPKEIIEKFFDDVYLERPHNNHNTPEQARAQQEFDKAMGAYKDYDFGNARKKTHYGEGTTLTNMGSYHPGMVGFMAQAMEPQGLNVKKYFDLVGKENWYGMGDKLNSDRGMMRMLLFRDTLRNNSEYKPKIADAQVFEVFLNIKKPCVMEHEISRDEFSKFMEVHKREDFYLDDIFRPEEAKAVGFKDGYSMTADEMTYDRLLKSKQLLRDIKHTQSRAATAYSQGFKAGDPVWKVFQQTPREKLTWGDLQYILTNTQKNHYTVPFNQSLKAMGFDGISHLGGWNIGTKSHRVWIAFDPKQVKATTAKEFDSNSADIYKARDTSKLTKKTITNRAGKKQTVWVRTGQDVPGEGKKKKGKSGGDEKPSAPSAGKQKKMGALKKMITAMRGEKDPVKKRSMFKNVLKGIFDSTSATFAGRSGGDVAAENVQSTAEIGKSKLEAKKAAAEKKAASAELNAGADTGSKK